VVDSAKTMGIDQNEKSGIMSQEVGLRNSEDKTFRLMLADEKFLKRIRQLNDAIVLVVIYGGRPILMSFSGKVEVLDKFQT
jgi:hypothetical protein